MNREQVREALEAAHETAPEIHTTTCAHNYWLHLADAVMALNKPPTEAYARDSQTASRATVTREGINECFLAKKDGYQETMRDVLDDGIRNLMIYLTAAGVEVTDG